MSIAAVILAGGEGRRIGGGKPLRTLGGMTLLERASRQAGKWSDSVAIAVRADTQIGCADFPVILDDPDVEGPIAGLAAALRFARDIGEEALLTLPADMPFLPEDLAPRLQEGIGPDQAAIASSGGHLHPVCGLWRTGAMDELPGYITSGRRSLKGFAGAIGFVSVEWPCEPIDPFFNINSLDDLAAAERMLRA